MSSTSVLRVTQQSTSLESVDPVSISGILEVSQVRNGCRACNLTCASYRMYCIIMIIIITAIIVTSDVVYVQVKQVGQVPRATDLPGDRTDGLLLY